jgi:antitoxin ParD1/3/4
MVQSEAEMAKSTSFNLSGHSCDFIAEQVEPGRLGSASEVVREGLRLVEERETRLQTLHQSLIEGEESGQAGPLDMEEIKRTARAMARAA